MRVFKMYRLVYNLVRYDLCREALDFHKIMWQVRSKVVHAGVMKALKLEAVCDLLSVGFLWDLINCYTG